MMVELMSLLHIFQYCEPNSDQSLNTDFKSGAQLAQLYILFEARRQSNICRVL